MHDITNIHSNYRRIGDFIELVDERNKKLEVDTLVGLSISKEFIPSVANTIGTNMANYKIIRKNQFACSLMQVRRDKKIPVALLQKFDEAIISQAYPVFQIKDESELIPQYLMMWMSRSEFDRHACFLAVGGVRGSLEWDDFCDMELPIPSIEKQREIVKEYNTIVNRIKLNEQLNKKLEETAQALYKHWFVDFEFPIYCAQGKPNADGKPYKSSGGKMVFNAELDKEIPEGWVVDSLENVTKQVCVGFVGVCFESYCKKEMGVPMLRTTDLKENGMSYKELKYVTHEFHNKNTKSQLHKGDILVARHGTNGMPVIFDGDFEANCLNAIIIKPEDEVVSTKLLHCYLNSESVKEQVQSSLGGSVQPVLNTKIISKLLFSGCKVINMEFSLISNKIQKQIEIYRKELFVLTELYDLILSKMTKVETEREVV